MIRYAKLPLPFAFDAVKKELAAFAGQWMAHFNTYHYEGEWTVLALRSAGGSGDTIIPENHGDAGYTDTPLMAQCPSVKELVSGLQCPVMAVRFLNLRKGAVIKPHRDIELAFEKGEARLHFPILTNSGVRFFVEDAQVAMHEGDCWYINANLQHQVSNQGQADRIHLVIDCKVNDWLEALFERAAERSVREEDDQQQLENIILELRRHRNPASDELADSLQMKIKL